MASSPSSSRSEGEIVEADLEKATTSLVEPKNLSVDRHSRKRASISRSPSPYRSPRRHRSRSGSRSPYREHRGPKRPAEDDHYSRKGNDPRRFKVRYEDRSTANRVFQSSFQTGQHRRSNVIDQRTPYDDLDTEKGPWDGYHKRSRSPLESYRAYQGRRTSNSRHERVDSQSSQKSHGTGYDESRSKLLTQQSVSDRSHISFAAAHSKTDAEISLNHKQQNNPDIENSGPFIPKYVLNSFLRPTIDDGPRSDKRISPEAVPAMAEDATEKPVDEATLIEERRRRREAIKAKHKGQTTPLLVQALAIDKSAPSTPKGGTATEETPAPGDHPSCKEDMLKAD